MSYRDTYYEEVDSIFGAVKPNPMNDQPDGNAVAQESGQPLGPTGWVENADGTDGEAKVIINANGITVLEGKIAVQDASGNTNMEGGVIKNVTNEGADVIIDENGLTVIDGAIIVSNAAATVIIDGSSNMFKIMASGTLDITAADPGSPPSAYTLASVIETLTGLGTFTETPGHISWTGSTFLTDDERSLGPRFTIVSVDEHDILGLKSNVACVTYLDGSDQCVVRLRVANFISGSTHRGTARYNVTKEAAI